MDTAIGDLLEQATVGLGWLADTEGTAEYDLDVWAFMLGSQQMPLGATFVVYYNQRTSSDGSIVLSGDERIGAGGTDNETLAIDFARIDPDVEEIVVAASIHDATGRGQVFYRVQDAYAHITDTQNGAQIARYDLSGDFGTDSAVELARFSRQGTQWQCDIVGRGARLGMQELLGLYGLHVALGKKPHVRATLNKSALPSMRAQSSPPTTVASRSSILAAPRKSRVAYASTPPTLPSTPRAPLQIKPESRLRRLGIRCIGALVLVMALWCFYAYLLIPKAPINPAMPQVVPEHVPATVMVTVSAVTFGSALSGNGHVAGPKNTFAPTDTVYALIVTSQATTSLPVRLNWLYGNPRKAVKVENEILRAGQSRIVASIPHKGNLLPGKYSLDISLDGRVVDTAHFFVRKNVDVGGLDGKPSHDASIKTVEASSAGASVKQASSLPALAPAGTTRIVTDATLPIHPAVQPSFDCQSARTPTEVAICASDDLSRLDASMGNIYRQAIGQATPSQAISIKRKQRQWLIDESAQCAADSTCITDRHHERIQALGQVLVEERDYIRQHALADKRSSQLEQGQLAAADRCFETASYDCSIQIAKALLSANPNDNAAAELLRRSQEAQNKALRGDWNIH